MGTNYYIHFKECPHCGKADEPYHIGKSSCGWHFALHVDPEKGITDLQDVKELFSEEGCIIRDEYGTSIPQEDMLSIITDRKSERNVSPEFCLENNCDPGFNGLARSRVDGVHCIGAGRGTWDLLVGEFS